MESEKLVQSVVYKKTLSHFTTISRPSTLLRLNDCRGLVFSTFHFPFSVYLYFPNQTIPSPPSLSPSPPLYPNPKTQVSRIQ